MVGTAIRATLFARLARGAAGGAVGLALVPACDAEPAADNDTEGGAAGMIGAAGAGTGLGGAFSAEDLGGGGPGGASGEGGEGGASHTAGQGSSGGEPLSGGAGGEAGTDSLAGWSGAGGSAGEAGAAGAGGGADICIEPLPADPTGAPWGTQLPSFNDACFDAGNDYTAHYFELAKPTRVRFGLRRSLDGGRNEYAVLSSGCTGKGPILAELGYCQSNVLELPAGSYSWGGCGLGVSPYNRYIFFGEAPSPAPTNVDCASALQLLQYPPTGTGGLVFDSTPRYYAFTYDEYAAEIWLSRPDLYGGGTLHVEVVDGCGVDAVTYDSWDFNLCHEDVHRLVGLEYGAVYYLRVVGWDPGAQWALYTDGP